MMLGADRVDAATGREWGLVNEIVPAGSLLQRALDLAEAMAARDPDVVSRVLGLIQAAGSMEPAAALRAEREENDRWSGRRRTRPAGASAG